MEEFLEGGRNSKGAEERRKSEAEVAEEEAPR